MYNNFTEYWEAKKTIYKKLGVTKEAAQMIWNDAVDLVEYKLNKTIIEKFL